jgi:YidC/Oxa1 family membrane protein insertase
LDSQRLVLLFALALILLLIWQAWEQEHAPLKTPAPVAAPADQPTTGTVPHAPTTDTSGPIAAVAPKISELESATQIEVTTDVLQAVIDTQGGDLRRLYLRKHPVAVDKPEQPFHLLNDRGDELYVAQSGLIGHGSGYPTHKVRYASTKTRYSLADGQEELRVPLDWRAPDGNRYRKTYVFYRDSYAVDVEFKVTNMGHREWKGFFYGQLMRTYKEEGGFFAIPTYTGGAIYTVTDRYQKISFADMLEQPLQRESTGGWVAMLQHYFVGAWMPKGDARTQLYTNTNEGARYVIGFKSLEPTLIAPRQTGTLGARLYVGPKETWRLKRLSEGMDLTVDYGWLTVISAPLFWLLEFIHRWVGNWGWAIILLTVLIKLAFYPLSAASYKSMAHMKKVQPRMQALKERYGNDKQKFQQAMMEMYKTEKINPLGGCLPILIQIPVFIALYWVLLESVEMRQAPFVLWIKDLSLPDPFFVLPVIMGVTMFLQQKMNPTPMDPMQKKIFAIMPFAFTVFFLFFPAGLVLYWVVNNVLSIAQQWRISQVIEGKTK